MPLGITSRQAAPNITTALPPTPINMKTLKTLKAEKVPYSKSMSTAAAFTTETKMLYNVISVARNPCTERKIYIDPNINAIALT